METTASLERIYPDEPAPSDPIELESIELHLARYRFAATHAKGRLLLDLASGSGYGTALIAQANPHISCVGLDIDPQAVSYARDHYTGDNPHFLEADYHSFSPPEQFDTIVSLETIEHLPDPDGFVFHLTRMLKPDGIIIASVPITPTKDGNPYHLHDFTERSFHLLFSKHGWRPLETKFYQDQTYFRLSSLIGKRPKTRTKQVPRNLAKYYLRHPAAILTRLGAMCRFGFSNRYLTSIFRRET